MDLSTLGGGGSWESVYSPLPVNFQNLPQGELLRVTPTSEQTVRLNLLAIWGTTGSAIRISVLMGTKKLLDKRTISPIFSTSGTPDTIIGRGAASTIPYIEGKKGEALVINSENVGGVGNNYLFAAYEIGVYA